MLRNGAHPEQIRAMLGHADLKTLSQYLQVGLADLKAMHEKSNPGK
jgi:site-specific recombinase XerD